MTTLWVEFGAIDSLLTGVDIHVCDRHARQWMEQHEVVVRSGEPWVFGLSDGGYSRIVFDGEGEPYVSGVSSDKVKERLAARPEAFKLFVSKIEKQRKLSEAAR